MVWLMCGDINKTFNRLITATMLVIVLIACERMPENNTAENNPTQTHNIVKNAK